MQALRTIAGFIFVTACLLPAARVQAQTQSVEITYGYGMSVLGFGSEELGTPIIGEHFGYATYRFMGKKIPLGFSAGLQFSGYSCERDVEDRTGNGEYVSVQSAYFALPLMMEGIAGRWRVKFVYNLGFNLLFSIKTHFYYSNSGWYNPPNLPPPNPIIFEGDYNKLQLLQIGVPITGLGIQIDLSRLFYLRLTLENSFYFYTAPNSQYAENALGLFDTFILKLAFGYNFKKKELSTEEQLKHVRPSNKYVPQHSF